MPLTLDEIAAIRTDATCFRACTYGTSFKDRSPTLVVAQLRGARFDRWQGNVYPHSGDDCVICDGAVSDLALATGCATRTQYYEMLELLGDKILEQFI